MENIVLVIIIESGTDQNSSAARLEHTLRLYFKGCCHSYPRQLPPAPSFFPSYNHTFYYQHEARRHYLHPFLAPTGALIVTVVYYIYNVRAAAAATF